MNQTRKNDQISERILEFLYGELSPEEEDRVRQRVESDPSWKEEYRILESTFRALDAWQDRDVPVDAANRVRGRVDAADRVRARVARERPAAARAWFRLGWERLGPVAAAVLVSGVILWTLTSSLTEVSTSVKDLLFCGVLWGGVYHLVFLVLMKREPSYLWVPAGSRGFLCLELRRAVLWAVVAFVLFFGTALATPNPVPFETRPMYLGLAGRIPSGVAFLPTPRTS